MYFSKLYNWPFVRKMFKFFLRQSSIAKLLLVLEKPWSKILKSCKQMVKCKAWGQQANFFPFVLWHFGVPFILRGQKNNTESSIAKFFLVWEFVLFFCVFVAKKTFHKSERQNWFTSYAAEKTPLQTGNPCITRNQKISEEHGIIDPQTTISKIGERNG